MSDQTEPKFNVGAWVFADEGRKGIVLAVRPTSYNGNEMCLYMVQTQVPPAGEIPGGVAYGSYFENELSQREE